MRSLEHFQPDRENHISPPGSCQKSSAIPTKVPKCGLSQLNASPFGQLLGPSVTAYISILSNIQANRKKR